MTVDTKKKLSLFDEAAKAHGWAQDMGTRQQAAIALTNYQRARADLAAGIDAQAAEIERLHRALRVAVLALANAVQDHGNVYQDAYEVVDAALKFAQEQGESNGNT